MTTNHTAFECIARVAHTSRVLVALFQRDELYETRNRHLAHGRKKSSRRWNTIASTRDVCATRRR